MPLIDLTRQAKAPTTGSLVLLSSAVTSSITGLYDLQWGTVSIGGIGTGSLDLGTGNILSVGYLKLYNDIIYNSSDETTLELLSGGGLKIYGDLYVEGTSSIQNVTTFAVEDPIIDLNYSGSNPLIAADAGLNVGRSGSLNAQLLWDNDTSRWQIDNATGTLLDIVGSTTTDTLTNKTITGLASSTMGSGANLTFSGGGEVNGLPNTPDNNGSATSRYYVDSEIATVGTLIEYLRKQYVKIATLVTVPNIVHFNAVSASAPGGLTTTNEDDFMFFINGQYMEHDALTIQQSGSTFILNVDTGSIGYSLESNDEIIAWGKFNA